MLKQVIVVRKDLKMPSGKLGAQIAHGSLEAFLNSTKTNQDQWRKSGATKIILQVNSEEELLDIYQQAKQQKLACALICDAAHTFFKEPTYTVVGIGPDDSTIFFTDNLRLY